MGKNKLKKPGQNLSAGTDLCLKTFFLLLPIFFLSFFSYIANGQEIHTVRSIEFRGNNILSAGRITAVISTRINGLYSSSVLADDQIRIMNLYKENAFLHTQINSIQLVKDSTAKETDIIFNITEGKQSILRRIEIDGCRIISQAELYSAMQLSEGDPFIPSLLEQDIQSILKIYENKGYPLSKIKVKNITFSDSTSEISTVLQLSIDEGKPLYISQLYIEGNKSTREYVIMREARITENELFSSDLPERIKRRLDHLQLFSSVSLPELYLTDKEQAGLLVRVAEGNHNNFDGMLGYVPPAASGEKGYITGLANISLRNLFGTGRKISIRWYQENRNTQEVELHYFEPWVASLPVNAQIGLFQRKQDSTYVRMQYDITARLMITEEITAGISFLQNNVYPTERYDKSRAIAESKTSSWGISLSYDSRDNPATPSSGILYSTEYQTGKKRTIGSNTVSDESKSSTRRILFDLSYYLSPFFRQVIASELHLRDFSSGNMDASDLYRLGGATTLRGYMEGQFLASRLLWINLEYRFLVTSLSFFYAFIDFGHISPFSSNSGLQISEQNKIGYGIGVRMDSALGLIGVSIALGESDTFSTAKIHIRLMNEF